MGYIFEEFIKVPGIGPGQSAILQIKVFNGASWEASTCRGESIPIIIELSGGLSTPADMIGLQPFQVICVPEPRPLLFLGLALFGVGFQIVRKR